MFELTLEVDCEEGISSFGGCEDNADDVVVDDDNALASAIGLGESVLLISNCERSAIVVGRETETVERTSNADVSPFKCSIF